MHDGIRRPWRYRCPHCGSSVIYRFTQHSLPAMNDPRCGHRIATSGHKRGIAYNVPRWKCRVCNKTFDTPKDMLHAEG